MTSKSLTLTLLLCFHLTYSAASIVEFLPQSFFFDYNKDTEPVPVPVTSQCETISIKWSRTSQATGPDPVAPYYLQVYTSAFVFPFIVPAGNGPTFDWRVPFAPGTLYQICMVDKEGNSGGCQDIYSTIPPSGSQTCSNVTFPLGPLDVSAVQSSGTLSQFGWINQCTDIGITPKNGTPPYTLTIAPTLHPPTNITLNDMSQYNWTVSLSWASSFFLSVVDAEGNFWSNGPLHSGGGAGSSTKCLSSEIHEKEGVSPAIPVGAGLGGLALGLLVGIASAVFFFRRKDARRRKYTYHPDRHIDETYVTPYDQHNPTSPISSQPLLDTSPRSPPHGGQNPIAADYLVEPFSIPTEHGQLPSPSAQSNDPTSPQAGTSTGSRTSGGRIYVVHHDAEHAPVTVFHEDGTQVVELPPQYDREQLDSESGRVASSGGSSDRRVGPEGSDTNLPGFLQQQRHPDITRKAHPARFDRPR